MWKIIQSGVFIMSIASHIIGTFEYSTWGIPSWVWLVISYLLLVAVFISVFIKQRMEIKELTIVKGVQFSSHRKSIKELNDFLNKYDAVYAIFPMGDSLKINNIFDSKRFKQVVVADPEGEHLKNVPDGYYMKDTNKFAKEVQDVIEHIKTKEKSKGIDVKKWDGCFPFSMFIGNPSSDDGGILLETHLPFVEGSERPNLIFTKKDSPELFMHLYESYKRVVDNIENRVSKNE